jgi:hypothetical protein
LWDVAEVRLTRTHGGIVISPHSPKRSTLTMSAGNEYLVTITTNDGQTSTTRHITPDDLDTQSAKVLAVLGLAVNQVGRLVSVDGEIDIVSVTVQRVN